MTTFASKTASSDGLACSIGGLSSWSTWTEATAGTEADGGMEVKVRDELEAGEAQ